MTTTASLIEGYTAYSSLAELDSTTPQMAPGLSPTPSISAFLTASSMECVMFSIGGAGGTVAAGC